MPGMICAFPPCCKSVTGGHRVEVHRVGSEELVFGSGIKGQALADVAGPLVRLYHSRCWWAQVKRDRLLAARAADLSGHPGRGPDWREPETCDVEELRGGLDGDYRGAGTAPD